MADLHSETTEQEQQTRPASTGLPTVTRRCEVHGEYQARQIDMLGKIITSGCFACANDEAMARQKAEERSAEASRKAAISRNIERSGVPQRFIGKSFDDYAAECRESAYALKVCRAYAERFKERLAAGGGLVMCGSPGTGKNHLACSIVLAVIRAGFTAGILTAANAVRMVRDTYRKDSERTERDAIAVLTDVDLLVLDEVGLQSDSDHERRILFDVINSRYENMTPTILISNLPQVELTAFIGERVMDRMQEGGGVVIPFTWASYRSKKQ